MFARLETLPVKKMKDGPISLSEGIVIRSLPDKFKILRRDKEKQLLLLELRNKEKVLVTFTAMECWLRMPV